MIKIIHRKTGAVFLVAEKAPARKIKTSMNVTVGAVLGIEKLIDDGDTSDLELSVTKGVKNTRYNVTGIRTVEKYRRSYLTLEPI